MESQTPSLVWSSHLKNSDLNSIPVPFRRLLFSMACLLVARISLSASPTLLPAWHSPSVKRNTHFSQPNPSQLLSENCWLPLDDAGGSQRVPSMIWSVFCPLCPSVHLGARTGPSAFHTVPLVLNLQVLSPESVARRCKTSPGNSVTAAGLGSQFVNIKSDPHALFNILPSPKGH